MTDAQHLAVERLCENFHADAEVMTDFSLPEGYVYVVLSCNFHAGVSPEGVVSS